MRIHMKVHYLIINNIFTTYVVDAVCIGRIPKYSPEDLTVVAMDQRIRDLEKRCVTLGATLTMNTSHSDALEDDYSIVKLAIEAAYYSLTRHGASQ